jgi:hypothetical protein
VAGRVTKAEEADLAAKVLIGHEQRFSDLEHAEGQASMSRLRLRGAATFRAYAIDLKRRTNEPGVHVEVNTRWGMP